MKLNFDKLINEIIIITIKTKYKNAYSLISSINGHNDINT